MASSDTPLKDAGNTHLAAGRLSEALAAYDGALAAAEGKPAVLHANRAAALLRLGRHADALGAADLALEADGSYAKALFRRAQALEMLERLGETLVALRRLLEAEPANKEAAASLRRVHAAASARAATSGLSGASDAAAGLIAEGATEAQRSAHARKLAAISCDRERLSELVNCGGADALLSRIATLQLPSPGAGSGGGGSDESKAASKAPTPKAPASSNLNSNSKAALRFEEVDDEADDESSGKLPGDISKVAQGPAGAGSDSGTLSKGVMGALGSAAVLGPCVEALCSLLAAATPMPAELKGAAGFEAADEKASALLRAKALATLSAEQVTKLAHAVLTAAETSGALSPDGGGGGARRPDQAASPWPRLSASCILLVARLAAAAAAEAAIIAEPRKPGDPTETDEPSLPSDEMLALLSALAELTDRARSYQTSAEARSICRGCIDGWLIAASLPHGLASASRDDDFRGKAVRCLLPFALADRGASLCRAGLLSSPGHSSDSFGLLPDFSDVADPDGSHRHGALAALTPVLRARGSKGQANEAAVLSTFSKLCRPALAAADAAAAIKNHGEARAIRASMIECLAALAELNRQAAARACVNEGLPARTADWHLPPPPKGELIPECKENASRLIYLQQDERLCVPLCELYAHALAASELLSEKEAAVIALSQLRLCVQHPSPPVRCRAIVALAKAKAVHAALRPEVVSLRALLNGTLSLLTAAQPSASKTNAKAGSKSGAITDGLDLRARSQLSTYRWAVEGLMYLVALGEAKSLLLGVTEGTGLSSFKALAHFLHQAHAASKVRAAAAAGGSATESPAALAAASATSMAVASLHYPLAWCVWRLVGDRELGEDEKRLQREMAPEQIEQFKKIAKGQNKAAGAEPDAEDESAFDPSLLAALRQRLVRDDGAWLLAEIAAQAGSSPPAASTRAACAKAILALAQLPEARGQLIAQGGFSACLQLANGPGLDFGLPPGAPPRHDEGSTQKFDRQAAEAAASALAKMAISTDPNLLPGAGGASSAQAGLVRPLLRLLETAEHELNQFEAVMALTNLASAGPEMQERLMREGTWRKLQLLLAEDNPLLCRAAIECLANLATCDEAIDLILLPESTDLKIFLGMCESDDELTQQAASGACATVRAEKRKRKKKRRAGCSIKMSYI